MPLTLGEGHRSRLRSGAERYRLLLRYIYMGVVAKRSSMTFFSDGLGTPYSESIWVFVGKL